MMSGDVVHKWAVITVTLSTINRCGLECGSLHCQLGLVEIG